MKPESDLDRMRTGLAAMGWKKVVEPFPLKGVPVMLFGMSGDGGGFYWWGMGIGEWDITIPGGGWKGGPGYPDMWIELPRVSICPR